VFVGGIDVCLCESERGMLEDRGKRRFEGWGNCSVVSLV
jgi:hypothetical protein